MRIELMTTLTANFDVRPAKFSFEAVRVAMISAIFISAFFVKIEPAPTDLFSFIAILLFASSGLNFARSFAIPLLFLIIYLLAGLVSAIGIDQPVVLPHPDHPLKYSMVTTYTSVASILVAAYVTDRKSVV